MNILLGYSQLPKKTHIQSFKINYVGKSVVSSLTDYQIKEFPSNPSFSKKKKKGHSRLLLALINFTQDYLLRKEGILRI